MSPRDGPRTMQRQSTVDSKKIFGSNVSLQEAVEELDVVLTNHEKRYLLYVERGDTASVKHIINQARKLERRRPGTYNINCRDPMGRTSLHLALEQENLPMVEMLLEEGVQTGDALLFAIHEHYVEGVDTLLEYEEHIHKEGEPYSWEVVSPAKTNYPAGLTPMMLAAHEDHYEILKMLLERGAVIEPPHPLKCECDDCTIASEYDCLRFSLNRMSKYQALSSPSYICLTSEDPFSTAITLVEEFKQLSIIEVEFRKEYIELKEKVRDFSEALVKEVRTMKELSVIVNYDPTGEPWEPGQPMHLAKLMEAASYKQRKFVAHPHIQHLLEKMWLEGLEGFKRLDVLSQFKRSLGIACMFPIYCLAALYAPKTSLGKQMKTPIVKFLVQAGCYMTFLGVLIVACLQLEVPIIQLIRSVLKMPPLEENPYANPVRYMELVIAMFVSGFVWGDIVKIYKYGLVQFVTDPWNIINFVNNFFYMTWVQLRIAGLVREHLMEAPEYTVFRQHWTNFDHRLIAEGFFAAANVISFLKLLQWFCISNFTGPLALAVGRMVYDVVKFLCLYILTLTAFMCGMQLIMMQYGKLDEALCYSMPDGSANHHHEDACHRWRRFTNSWESAQTMFWTSFGFISLYDFEMTGVKPFTRVWILTMFGSYNVCNVIVLLNLLIAMLSNSYEKIMADVDTYWLFVRSELWMKYFHKMTELPSPFNLMPGIPSGGPRLRRASSKERKNKRATMKYMAVLKLLIKRFITTKHRKEDLGTVTTDNFTELRSDIHSFKYSVLDILKINGWKTNDKDKENVMDKKKAARERKINQDFRVGFVSDNVNMSNLVQLMMDDHKAKKKNKKIKTRGVGAGHDQIGSSSNLLKGSMFSVKSIATENPQWKLVKFYQVRGVFQDGDIHENILEVSRKRKERLKSQTTIDSSFESHVKLRSSLNSLNSIRAFNAGPLK
ncbi:unnamed protein product [Meganyctiphanes norvegica]|uniref:Transient receptor ion channel domain-containing protein n=1 Tax=Meganyctiphanes norvegica TaxID=48144 RepID=A0AAV2RJJ7_MEGNR